MTESLKLRTLFNHSLSIRVKEEEKTEIFHGTPTQSLHSTAVLNINTNMR